MALLSLLITVVMIVLTIALLERWFPNLPELVRAFIIASVVLAILRLLHSWVCGFLCGVGG